MHTTSIDRTIRLGGATAAFAAALVLAGAGSADAGKKKDRRDVELVRPANAPDADAGGVLRITTTKRGDKGVLKLRDLDPKTRYEVHDAATDEVLGRVRTNRRGRAKMKLRRKVRSAGKAARFEVPDEIEICRLHDDEPLLRAETDRPDFPEGGDLPAFGFAHYEGAEGWFAFVDMFSFAAEEIESFHLSLSAKPTERGQRGELYEYGRDTMAGDELPLGVDSVGDLSGRAFRVVGPEGGVLVRGVLPDLKQPRMRMPPEFAPPEFPFWGDDRPHDERPDERPNGDRPTDERPTDERPVRDGVAKFDGFQDDVPDFDFDFDSFPKFDGKGGFDDMMRMLPPDFMPFPMPEREESRLRLEIADEEGTLTDCGALDRIVFPEIDFPKWDEIEWPDWECPMDGDDHNRGDDRTGSDEGDDAAGSERDTAAR